MPGQQQHHQSNMSAGHVFWARPDAALSILDETVVELASGGKYGGAPRQQNDGSIGLFFWQQVDIQNCHIEHLHTLFHTVVIIDNAEKFVAFIDFSGVGFISPTAHFNRG